MSKTPLQSNIQIPVQFNSCRVVDPIKLKAVQQQSIDLLQQLIPAQQKLVPAQQYVIGAQQQHPCQRPPHQSNILIVASFNACVAVDPMQFNSCVAVVNGCIAVFNSCIAVDPMPNASYQKTFKQQYNLMSVQQQTPCNLIAATQQLIATQQ